MVSRPIILLSATCTFQRHCQSMKPRHGIILYAQGHDAIDYVVVVLLRSHSVSKSHDGIAWNSRTFNAFTAFLRETLA